MISFGTDGWRAIIGDEFTFANVARFGAALARLIVERGWQRRGIVIGYDRRFMSGDFARLLALATRTRGIRTLLCSSTCPTPAVGLGAAREGTALAAIVTASHNPYRYNGIKLRDSLGAPVGDDILRDLSAMLGPGGRFGPVIAGTAGPPAAADILDSPVELYEPFEPYRAHVSRLVDTGLIARRSRVVIHDAMHGSAAGWLSRLLPGVETIREESDPTFNGSSPEPILGNLAGLRRRIRASRLPAVGLATDGDGDRLAAIAEDGSFVDPHHLLALLYLHLVEVRGIKGPAARTVTTSTLVDRLAARYGLEVSVTPVGFKHLSRLLKATAPGSPVIGGEESGGIGVAMHMPERDAVFAAMLLLEHLAARETTLAAAVDNLRKKAGQVWLGRSDIRVASPVADAIEGGMSVPDNLIGEPVASWERLDGLKLRLADGSWLHVRASHTEPVLRLYAEAGSPQRLQALLGAGRDLIGPHGPFSFTASGSNPPHAPVL